MKCLPEWTCLFLSFSSSSPSINFYCDTIPLFSWKKYAHEPFEDPFLPFTFGCLSGNSVWTIQNHKSLMWVCQWHTILPWYWSEAYVPLSDTQVPISEAQLPPSEAQLPLSKGSSASLWGKTPTILPRDMFYKLVCREINSCASEAHFFKFMC